MVYHCHVRYSFFSNLGHGILSHYDSSLDLAIINGLLQELKGNFLTGNHIDYRSSYIYLWLFLYFFPAIHGEKPHGFSSQSPSGSGNCYKNKRVLVEAIHSKKPLGWGTKNMGDTLTGGFRRWEKAHIYDIYIYMCGWFIGLFSMEKMEHPL